MFLQGNLQMVFDALYHLGVIDPVLKLDWKKEMAARAPHENKIQMAIKVANKYNTDLSVLRQQLGQFDKKTLSFLAMEVAKEYADYHWREDLH